MSSSGTLVTERPGGLDGREVSAWVPDETPTALVVAGDGALIAPWGATLTDLDLPSTMIIGVHRTADETARLHEYSPGFDPERFAAHERFLVEDVRDWTRDRFGVEPGPSRTAILGVSAGAELALALGLRHPDRFGVVLAASPGAGFRPPEPLPDRSPRTYLLGGTREPFFLENAARWATALQAAGADVVLHERDAGHDAAMWRAELPLMLRWAFGSGA